MGKSDENQTKKSAHRATTGESKHMKSKPIFDTLEIIPFATTFEDNRQSRWRDHFRQLCEYKVQFGHCIMPQRYPANPKLAQWVRYQRTRYKNYTEDKPNPMTAEHIRALDSIGFDWGTSKTDSTTIWNARFRELCEFKVQFGHSFVPLKYSANPKLGKWVTTQRRKCKLHQEGKEGHLTEERIRALRNIGFERSETSAAIWDERFERSLVQSQRTNC